MTHTKTAKVALILVVAIIAALSIVPAAFAAGDFVEPASSPEPVPDRAIDLAAGDFNEDGERDLAVPIADDDAVSILLGDGAGGFSPASTSPESSGGAFPRSISVGDFNEDTHQDLAVGNDFDNTVAVLLGDGTGNFTLSSTGPEADAAGFASVVGDFDEDDNQDIASSNFFIASVRLLFGDGAGDFAATVDEPAGLTPTSLAIGDFNEDANQDLAVSNGQDDGAVTILLGDGDGGFAPAASSPEDAGDSTSDVVVSDFDNDGNQDLAVSNRESDSVTVLLGNGAGDFTEPTSSPLTAEDLLNSLTSADYNGDGNADLAVAGEFGQVFVFFGDGTGGFAEPASSPETVSQGFGAQEIITDDFNGDGLPDLAFSTAANDSEEGDFVNVLLNRAEADLRVSKSDSPDPVAQGGLLTYTVDVRNAGPEAARSVAMRDTLPAEVDFVSASSSRGTCSRSGRLVSCGLGTLANGATARVTIVVRAREAGRLTNVARVSSPVFDPAEANNASSQTTTVRGSTPPPPPPPACTITGTGGNDVIRGTPGNDVICAGDGNDVVTGNGGNDTVRGASGNDVLRGGTGNDRVEGGAGDDVVIGEDGDDRLFGGGGADRVSGHDGRDSLDVSDGTRGNDAADGGGGSDSCSADPGDRRTSC